MDKFSDFLYNISKDVHRDMGEKSMRGVNLWKESSILKIFRILPIVITKSVKNLSKAW